MTISPDGVKKICAHEGCELKVYLDRAGLPTIGVGHLIKRGELFPTEGITQERADELLADDLKFTVDGVNACLEVEVTQAQFDALVSFAFNVGIGALRSSSLLRAVNLKESNEVIRERLARWNKVTINGKKVEVAGLTKRRAAEGEAWP